ncbi:hypothetical protein LBMAG54_12150 [Nitrosopumilaceae archaeon]|nr:hypothetical protein EMGBD3_11140 [Nitrosarchaeum sp.]GDY16359.1 hypothetical protein LBMAG54_12150 [Nitrosopumilaceae archaeon]
MSEKKVFANKMELLSVMLLALIIVFTAWSAYQSTLWGGIQTFKLVDVNAANRQASELNLQQGQYTMIDVMMFTEYVNAVNNDDKKLSDFYFERFRPDFKPAVQSWLDTNPFDNPNAPPHPFVMKEYKRTFAEQAEQKLKIAELKMDEAQQANQNSDNYVLFTVIYASILFLGSIATKFSSVRLNQICFIIGVASFAVITVSLFVIMPIAME